jgi:NhaP-type Na+/H+ or K+/H+ antiporter
VLLGGIVSGHPLSGDALWFAPLLLLIIRPLSVLVALAGTRTPSVQKSLVAWFGIRGIGSIYYLAYAIQHGLPEDLAQDLVGITLATVTVSILVHGISVTPLMQHYTRAAPPA